MIDFKPIGEFTFDDCVNSIERHKSEGLPIDAALQTRYEDLLFSLKDQEKQDYSSCNTIQSLEKYVIRYSSLSGATKYQPQYIKQAKSEIERLKKRKRHIKYICVSIFILFVTIILFFGYESPDEFQYILTDYSISNEGGKDVYLGRVSDKSTQIQSNNINWRVSISSDSILLYAEKNRENEINGLIEITSCAKLYGIPIKLIKSVRRISVSQKSGKGSFLDVQRNISLSGIGGVVTVPIKTDGVWEVNKDESADWYSVTCLRDSLRIYSSSNETGEERESKIQININSSANNVSSIIETITLKQRSKSSFWVSVENAQIDYIEDFGFHYMRIGKILNFDYLQGRELGISLKLIDEGGNEIDSDFIEHTPSSQDETATLYFTFGAQEINKFIDRGKGEAYGIFEVYLSDKKIPTFWTYTDANPKYSEKQWLFRLK